MSAGASERAVDPRRQRNALVAAAVSIVAAGSYTTLAGLLTAELGDAYGWSASSISGGIGLNMALYGLTAPFAIYAMQKYGIRTVSIAALCVLILGGMLSLIPNVALFNAAWGLLVGIGTGALTMAYGALVARMWFRGNQGTVAGFLTAAAVLGQFGLLPVWAEMAEMFGWRAPLIGCAALSVVAIFVNLRLMSDERRHAPNASDLADAARRHISSIFMVLFSAFRSVAFWLLAAMFAICGATTNGIMWSHFVPACIDAGMTATAASGVLFLIGVFNVFGTMAAGWLSDRISARLILTFVFGARAVTLLWLPLIITSDFDPQIATFGILFGILDVATVPPVIALCNRVFDRDGPAIFGWVNGFHQIGAGMMALAGGLIRTSTGSYALLWTTAGVLCIVAAALPYASAYRGRTATAEA